MREILQVLLAVLVTQNCVGNVSMKVYEEIQSPGGKIMFLFLSTCTPVPVYTQTYHIKHFCALGSLELVDSYILLI